LAIGRHRHAGKPRLICWDQSLSKISTSPYG
jgi:hypothetical protein